MPLWQAVKQTYTKIFQASWKRLISYKIARQALWTTAITILVYIVVIASAAIAIYNHHTTNKVTRFIERLFPYPAAIVDGTVIPLSRYRIEIDTRNHYVSEHNLPTTSEETSKFVINQLIDRTLYAHAITKNGIKLDENDLTNKLQDIYNQVGGQEKLSQFLTQQYGSSASLDLFKTWMRDAATESAVQNQLLVKVTVRHILIATPENATQDQIDAAKTKAQDIKNSITDPSQFGEVAKNKSEDVASRDKGGDFGTTNRGDDAPVLSKDFEDAIFSLPVGKISDPIRSPFGWHIVIVDKRDGTIDLSKKAYTQQLIDQGHVHKMIGL